jgi:hypothetical protein
MIGAAASVRESLNVNDALSDRYSEATRAIRASTNGMGAARRYECLSQTDRHHRSTHTERTRAVASLVSLVNHRLDHRQRRRAV